MNFETRPVVDLPVAAPRGPFGPTGHKGPTGFLESFGALSPEMALFVPRNGRDWGNVQRGGITNAKKHYPDRLFKTRIDREKDGVWFWWEPRP